MEFREGMEVKIRDDCGKVYYGECAGKGCTLNGRVGVIVLTARGSRFVSVRFSGISNPCNDTDVFIFKTDDLELCETLKNGYYDYTRKYRSSSELIPSKPAITKVLYNDPATIVFWDDGTKTIVKCGKHEEFDPEKGLAMAISKKAFGNKGNYYDEFKKWLPKTEGESAIEKAIKYMDAISEDAVLDTINKAAEHFITTALALKNLGIKLGDEDSGDVNNE